MKDDRARQEVTYGGQPFWCVRFCRIWIL